MAKFSKSMPCNFFKDPSLFALLGKLYDDLKKKAENIKSDIDGLKKGMNKLSNELIDKNGQDPVILEYSKIFTEEVILRDPSCWKNLQEFQDEKKERYGAEIPPGYKDANKENGNDGGDLIIWKSILEEAKKQGKDCIFVTNDAKEDWFFRVNNRPIMPRRELLEEFRHKTDGKTLHIINFEQFLELWGAPSEVQKEAAAVESEIKEAKPYQGESPNFYNFMKRQERLAREEELKERIFDLNMRIEIFKEEIEQQEAKICAIQEGRREGSQSKEISKKRSLVDKILRLKQERDALVFELKLLEKKREPRLWNFE